MRRLSILLVNLGFLLTVLFLNRLVLLLAYAEPGVFSGKDLLAAFLAGMRFDIVTAAYILAPLILLAVIPFLSRNEKYLKLTTLLSLIWLIVITVYLFVDLLYYPFSERHLTFELFTIEGGDFLSLVQTGMHKYIPEVLGILLFLAALSFLYIRLIRKIFQKPIASTPSFFKSMVKDISFLFAVVVVTVIMARGGIQMKPLKVSDAYVTDAPYLGNLALNGLYTTLKSFYGYSVNKEGLWWKIRYFPSEDTAKRGQEMIVSLEKEGILDPAYPLYRHFKYRKKEFKPLNVVIFVMESWSGKFIGSLGGEIDATPFFSGLSRKGVLFRHFFASGQRSIEGISAILTSIPPWGGMILSQNPTLSQVRVRCLPSMLEEAGYQTFFIHGAKYGSMGFNSFVKHARITTYISKEEIEKDGGRDDGVWGIFDEDTFLYAHKLFEVQQQPFFTIIYSLSSHTPYRLPSKDFAFYGKEIPFSDYLNSLRYSDYALSRFFEKAREASYFKDTVFIIVGDHTEGRATHNSLFTMFHIPCLIYAPYHLKPVVMQKPVTQVDLAPTILDILHYSKPHASFGTSAFTKDQGLGLLSYGDFMVFVHGDWMLLSSLENSRALFNYREAPAQDVARRNLKKLGEMEREIRYYIQFINDMVVRNHLLPRYPAALGEKGE